MNYAATSSCLGLLQRGGACAAHNHLVLATRVLKLSNTIRVHHTVLQSVPVHSSSGEEGVFPLLSVTVGHNMWSVVVSYVVVHWIT